jgi:hypothetical protein
MKTKFLKITMIILALSLCLSSVAMAESGIQPFASSRINAYNTNIISNGSGYITIYFNIIATGTMDELGASYIVLQSSTDGTSWLTTYNFIPSSYSSMMGYNVSYKSGSVSYSGIDGVYYRAYVTFKAKNSTGTDTVSEYTSTVRG